MKIKIFMMACLALMLTCVVSCSDDKDEPVVPPQEDETVDSPYPSFEEVMEIGEGFLWRITRRGGHVIYADTGEEYDGCDPGWPEGVGSTPVGIYFEGGKAHVFYSFSDPGSGINFIPEEPYDPKTGLIYRSKKPFRYYSTDIQIVAVDEEKITVRSNFFSEVFEDGSKGERLVCNEWFFLKQEDGVEDYISRFEFTDDPNMYP